MAYQIQTRDNENREWTIEGIGDVSANQFESAAAARKAIRELRKLGPDWAAAEYRVHGDKKRKRSSSPTVASIARQTARLDGARSATADAERHERAIKDNEATIKQTEKEIDTKKNDVKSLKKANVKLHGQAKAARAKAAKLAKPGY